MASAKNWEMNVDLQKNLVFPTHIAATTLRPDIVLWSNTTKRVILVELTVLWEERIQEANERKRRKYEDLLEECKSKGAMLKLGVVALQDNQFAKHWA